MDSNNIILCGLCFNLRVLCVRLLILVAVLLLQVIRSRFFSCSI